MDCPELLEVIHLAVSPSRDFGGDGKKHMPASVRARVADSIFAHASKPIEIEDIEARVSELERAAEAAKQFR